MSNCLKQGKMEREVVLPWYPVVVMGGGTVPVLTAYALWYMQAKCRITTCKYEASYGAHRLWNQVIEFCSFLLYIYCMGRYSNCTLDSLVPVYVRSNSSVMYCSLHIYSNRSWETYLYQVHLVQFLEALVLMTYSTQIINTVNLSNISKSTSPLLTSFLHMLPSSGREPSWRECPSILHLPSLKSLGSFFTWL